MAAKTFTITPLEFAAAWTLGEALLSEQGRALALGSTEAELAEAFPGRRLHIRQAFDHLSRGTEGSASTLGFAMRLPKTREDGVTYAIKIQSRPLIIHCGSSPGGRVLLSPPGGELSRDDFLELCLESLLQSAPRRLRAARSRPRKTGWLQALRAKIAHGG